MPSLGTPGSRQHSPIRPQPSPEAPDFRSSQLAFSTQPDRANVGRKKVTNPPSFRLSEDTLRTHERPANEKQLRLWIGKEVDAHVRVAMQEMAQSLPATNNAIIGSDCSLAVREQLASQVARQKTLEESLSSVETEQRRLAADFRQLRQQANWAQASDLVARRAKEASKDYSESSISRGSPPRSPEREPSSLRLPGIHAIHLNLADQAKHTRAIGEDIAALKDSVSTLRREVRAAAVGTDEARRVAESFESTVEQTMQDKLVQLRQEVVEETLHKANETWISHHAAIETLREQHQTTRQRLNALLESPAASSSATWHSEALKEPRHGIQGHAWRETGRTDMDSRVALSWDAVLAEASAQGAIGTSLAGTMCEPSYDDFEGPCMAGDFTLGYDQSIEESGIEPIVALADAVEVSLDSALSPMKPRRLRAGTDPSFARCETSMAYSRTRATSDSPSQAVGTEVLGALQNFASTHVEETRQALAPALEQVARKIPHRLRQATRWRVGQVFSSDSEADEDGSARTALSAGAGQTRLQRSMGSASELSSGLAQGNARDPIRRKGVYARVQQQSLRSGICISSESGVGIKE